MKSAEEFWNEKYRLGETGWDIGYVSTPIKEYVDQLEDKSRAILIPGAGNAWEAEYLIRTGFTNITVVDISSEAIKKVRNRIDASDAIHLLHIDFFELEGNYDLMIEQTFFCALDPSLRENYVSKAASLLRPDGCIAGVLFDKKFDKPGPPFGGNASEFRPLFSKAFDIEVLERCYNSIPPRMGSEVFLLARVREGMNE